MKNLENLKAEDFINAIINYGSDPFVIEDIETADAVMADFISKQYRVECTAGEDFNIYCKRLDLDTKTTKRVYHVYNWNEEGFNIAFLEDYE